MDFRDFSTHEQLVSYLRTNELFGLDSEYSPTISALKERLGAKGVHLNRWWVLTSNEWRCPACARSKREIVSIDRRGYLAGLLHRHHDHMKELVEKRFHEEAVRRDVVEADAVGKRFAVRAAFGLSAFDETIICADCNLAEGRANKLANTHQDFSFSPAEIRQFVEPAPNRVRHGIRVDIARNIWESSKEIFMTRLEMVDKIATLAASNTHWYQPSERSAAEVERHAKSHLAHNGLYELGRKLGVYDDTFELLYTTNVHRGSASSWRLKNSRSASGAPSEQDIEFLRRTRGKYWERVDENWNCPCCARTRYQCVRPGKQAPWIFDIKKKVLLDEEQGEIALCEDCSNVAARLAREVADDTGVELKDPSSILALGELRSIIRPQPHSHHKIDNENVEYLLPILEQRLYEYGWEPEDDD